MPHIEVQTDGNLYSTEPIDKMESNCRARTVRTLFDPIMGSPYGYKQYVTPKEGPM